MSRRPMLPLRDSWPIPSLTYVGPLLFLAVLFISYLKDPAVYPHFDIYRTGSPKEDRRLPLSTILAAQYPALCLCEFPHHLIPYYDL
jgi:hypothetical protein